MTQAINADYCVAGAGPAGAVLATKLAARSAWEREPAIPSLRPRLDPGRLAGPIPPPWPLSPEQISLYDYLNHCRRGGYALQPAAHRGGE